MSGEGHGSSLESTSSSASSLNRAWQRTLAPKRLWADTVDTPSQSLSQSLPQSLSQSHQSLSQSTPSPPRLRRGEPISAELVEEELAPDPSSKRPRTSTSHSTPLPPGPVPDRTSQDPSAVTRLQVGSVRVQHVFAGLGSFSDSRHRGLWHVAVCLQYCGGTLI